jgi:hypothetical protein
MADVGMAAWPACDPHSPTIEDGFSAYNCRAGAID